MTQRSRHETLSLKMIILAAAAGVAGGLLADRMPFDRPVLASEPTVVTAQTFKLVDGQGGTRAELSVSAGGQPALEFFDTAHRVRVLFDMSASGDPQLFLMDDHGSIRTEMGLGLESKGRPFVNLRDQDGNVFWSVVAQSHHPG
ncbi:MAG TPA: hypothetical protein VML36_02150 [Nitrospiria bacterium]|nr:hypothetical protein [Nitrospiria bacterium]